MLQKAEDQLRSLIQDCLGAQSYSDVAALAKLAESLATLRHDQMLKEQRSGPVRTFTEVADERPTFDRGDKAPLSLHHSSGSPIRQNGTTYPRFEREGDRLVKIGWSKKESRAYEHKAPRSVITAVCYALRSHVNSFTMETLLPITDSDGNDVPSYQVYVVIAWLRQLGVVERNGNDGYTVKQTDVVDSAIEKTWIATPEKLR
ncbi:MAG: hypothetical protein WKF55_00080 [Gemmatimonadaceae bacterium]